MLKYCDICVVFGGKSSENEISVITGTMACNVLKKGGKSVLPVCISQRGEIWAGEELADISRHKDGAFRKVYGAAFARGEVLLFGKGGRLKGRVGIGAILNCCHGGQEEGGSIAGLAAVVGVPLASAGLFESAAFMDKYLTKIVLKGLDAPVVPYLYVREGEDIADRVRDFGYPVIVKPCTLGSSIGIARAEDEAQLKAALDTAFSLDGAAIIERYLSPIREVNCAAYFSGGAVNLSPLEEVFAGGELLSYSDKYSGGGARTFPAKLKEGQGEYIQELTRTVYTALKMRGIVRFDYIICGEDIYISEINTVPGSLSQYLLSIGYSQFFSVLCGLVESAKADFAERASKSILHTGILNNIPSNACKIKGI